MKKGKSISFLKSGWLWGAIAGLLAGAVSGAAITTFRTEPELANLSARIAGVASTSTIPEKPEIEIIPIETRPLLTSLPSAFDERRRSPVLQIVETTIADVPVTEEQVIGSAISVTSDGWLITSYEAVEGLVFSGIRIANEGRLVPIEQAIRDQDTDIVYMKIDASGLPVADFVQARDVTVGAAAWTERQASVLRPASIMSVRARKVYAPVSSEYANRRYFISGNKEDGVAGQPVWDGRGKLIGLYESYNEHIGAWLVQPVGSVSRDLASLLDSGSIAHAGLSIYALDLEGVVLANRPDTLPSSGAWLRPGATGVSIAKTSPAFGKLEPGDVIERIERDILEGEADLGEILLEYRPGASVVLTVLRGEEQLEVELALEEIETSISLIE